jgi:hypothetical protein
VTGFDWFGLVVFGVAIGALMLASWLGEREARQHLATALALLDEAMAREGRARRLLDDIHGVWAVESIGGVVGVVAPLPAFSLAEAERCACGGFMLRAYSRAAVVAPCCGRLVEVGDGLPYDALVWLAEQMEVSA